MSRALGEIPVTIKLRTGVKDGRNNAHKIMPRAATEWGVGCITVRHRYLFITFSTHVTRNSFMAVHANNATRNWLIGST